MVIIDEVTFEIIKYNNWKIMNVNTHCFRYLITYVHVNMCV